MVVWMWQINSSIAGAGHRAKPGEKAEGDF